MIDCFIHRKNGRTDVLQRNYVGGKASRLLIGDEALCIWLDGAFLHAEAKQRHYRATNTACRLTIHSNRSISNCTCGRGLCVAIGSINDGKLHQLALLQVVFSLWLQKVRRHRVKSDHVRIRLIINIHLRAAAIC